MLDSLDESMFDLVNKIETIQENIVEEKVENIENEINPEIRCNVKDLVLYSDNYPFSLPYRIKELPDEKAFAKFVKSCEKLMRNTPEYRHWVNYITDVLGVNECVMTHEKIWEVGIDVHHHVPSLYLVAKVLINEALLEEREFTSLEIANKGMELHFQNKIGYVTLLSSMHQKFHNGFLQIPIELVKGDYAWFINTYGQYFDDEDWETINRRLSIKKDNCANYPYAWSA